MNTQQTHSLILDSLPLGKLFFLRLENAFLLAQKGDCIALTSKLDNLEHELLSWCQFKGERFLEKKAQKHCFTYILQKHSHTAFPHFQIPQQNSLLPLAPDDLGLAARGSITELASPNYYFELTSKQEVWSEKLGKLYEDSKLSQWSATNDIAWSEIPQYSPALEFATAQIMTYLVENEFSALYVPSKFLSKISPYYYEVPLLLSSIIGDEARHIEVFIKRANATGLGLQYSTRTTQQSLFTLFKEDDYLKSSFLLHIMGEGTFVDLLHFLESHAKDAPTKKLLYLARKDEMRHVAYGMNNIKNALLCNPQKVEILKNAVFKRKQYLDELSGESTLLLESLCVFAGGGEQSAQVKKGFEKLENLKAKMQKNRTKRLVECGIDAELAYEMSKAHTPNFM
ncbi:ferritin-like domain-containing protein [Helicobacter himalayensis]|uniref:ferritin-like domain-containing protein n=1 Tax=Helicobacter himalayensis TaxID=1591088 RepID=UPI003D6FD6FC